MTPHILIALIVFFAVFTQSVAGFGVALVAMALLPSLLSLSTATPLVALIALSLEMVLFIHYRKGLNVKAIWQVTLASIAGIPLGIFMLTRVDEGLVLTLLGIVLSGYALYALLNFKLPKLERTLWAYLAGLLAGLLGGAYNTSGPPVILYGHCRRWPPLEFKSNLQAFFLVSSTFVALGHLINRSYSPQVWEHFLWSLPSIGVGYLAGTALDRYLNPRVFRKIVLVLIFIMGLRLIFSA